MLNPGLTLGQITELTIVTPILAGQVELLRTTLQTLNKQRIFQPVEAIHFARYVIVTPPGGDVEHDSYLLFVSCYDGNFELLVKALAEHAAGALDAIWSHTPGWRGAGDAATLQAWILDHVNQASMAYTPYREATVKEIRKSLAVDYAVQDLFDTIRTEPAAAKLLQALQS